MELIERKSGSVRARREVILAFLPWRRAETKTELNQQDAFKEES